MGRNYRYVAEASVRTRSATIYPVLSMNLHCASGSLSHLRAERPADSHVIRTPNVIIIPQYQSVTELATIPYTSGLPYINHHTEDPSIHKTLNIHIYER